MPSSLTIVLSIALVFSTRPPVSVLVRARGTSLGAFLGGMVSGTSDITSPHPVSALMAGFRPAGLRGCPSSTNGWDPLSYPVLPSVITVPTWYGNINPLSIAYAFQPRLRSRLTLSRLALLRNPWAFGGGVSHSSFVTRASILTPAASTAGLPRRFSRHRDAPLPLRLGRNPQLRYLT